MPSSALAFPGSFPSNQSQRMSAMLFKALALLLFCSLQLEAERASPPTRVGLLVQGPPIKGIFRDAEIVAWALGGAPLRVSGGGTSSLPHIGWPRDHVILQPLTLRLRGAGSPGSVDGRKRERDQGCSSSATNADAVGSPHVVSDSELWSIFTCPSCLETLSTPHTVSCGHTVCEKCLRVGGSCPLGSCNDTRPGFSRDIVVGSLVCCLQEPHIKSGQFSEKLRGLRQEITCALCRELLHLPSTSPCGHTFCRPCLSRCLDHSTQCPCCRRDLGGVDRDLAHLNDSDDEEYQERISSPWTGVNTLLERLVRTLFPQEVDERCALELQREAPTPDGEGWIPVFVCSLTFPGIRFPLHVFEPRYKLMMRRCMGEGVFGMCASEEVQVGEAGGGHSFSNYGTLMRITSVQQSDDGTMDIDCRGEQAFKVLERGVRDGYHVARISRVDDLPVASGEVVNGLLQRVQDRAKALQVWDEGSLWEAVVCASGIPDYENITSLSWWLAATTSFLVGDDPGVEESLVQVLGEPDAVQRLNMTLSAMYPLPMRPSGMINGQVDFDSEIDTEGENESEYVDGQNSSVSGMWENHTDAEEGGVDYESQSSDVS